MRKNILPISIIVILIVLGSIFYFLQKDQSPLPTTQNNNANQGANNPTGLSNSAESGTETTTSDTTATSTFLNNLKKSIFSPQPTPTSSSQEE